MGTWIFFSGELKSFFFGMRILNMTNVNQVNMGLCSYSLILSVILDISSIGLAINKIILIKFNFIGNYR